MKKRLFFVLSISAWLLTQCASFEEHNPIEFAVVNFSPVMPVDDKSINPRELPNDLFLLLTLRNESGDTIFVQENIALVSKANKLLSDPVKLLPGKYHIDKFIVVCNDRVSYTASREGSKTPGTVQTFVVSTGAINNVYVNVNAISTQDESDAKKKPVNPLRIRVYENKNGRAKLTHAMLYIENADSTLFKSKILPKENVIPFTGEVTQTYRLRIVKDGFEDVLMQFNYSQYLSLFGRAPLKIVLTPSVVFGITTSAQFVKLYLTFQNAGALTIHWPGGESEVINFNGLPSDPDKLSFHAVTHEFFTSKNVVTFSGDIDKIVEFVSASPVDGISLTGLKNLRSLTLENSSIRILNLRENEALTSLAFVRTNIQEIIYPTQHRIESVSLEGTAGEELQFPLNGLIQNVCDNAIRRNLTGGAFIFLHAGQIWPISMDKLRHLQSAYSWYVEIE